MSPLYFIFLNFIFLWYYHDFAHVVYCYCLLFMTIEVLDCIMNILIVLQYLLHVSHEESLLNCAGVEIYLINKINSPISMHCLDMLTSCYDVLCAKVKI